MRKASQRLIGILLAFVMLVTMAPVTLAATTSTRSREFTFNGNEYIIVPAETRTVNGKTYYGIVPRSTTSYGWNHALFRLTYLSENTAGAAGVDIPVKVNILNGRDGTSIDIQSLLSSKFSDFGDYIIPSDTEWVLNTQNDSNVYYTGSVGMPSRSVFTTLYKRDSFTCAEGDTGFVVGELGFYGNYFYLMKAGTDGKANNDNPQINRNNQVSSGKNEGGTWVFMTYVSKDFFKNNVVDLEVSGGSFKTFLYDNYTKAELRGAGYSESEVVSLGFPASTVPATGVVLDKTELNVKVYNEGKLKASVLPLNEVADETVTWSSADTSIATIDENGIVYGKKVGQTTITATTVEGGFTADCTVNVTPSAEFYVAPDGNNSNPGTIEKPFATVQKAVDAMEIGDTVYLREGTYEESVEFKKSGTASAPLNIAAYNGENAVITGTQQIKNWTVDKTVGNNTIYKAYVGQNFDEDSMIFFNSNYVDYAKWPNNTVDNNPIRADYHDKTHSGLDDNWLFPTWGFVDSATGRPSNESDYNKYYGTIYDAELPFAKDELIGATMVTKPGLGWYMYYGSVTDSDVGNFYIRGTMQFHPYYLPTEGNQYYLYGAKCLLDYKNEWYSEGGYLYIITPDGTDPNKATITANVRKDAIDFNGNDYINVDGINFFAGEIRVENSDNLKLTNITNAYVAQGPQFTGNNNLLANSTIKYTMGESLDVAGNNNKVINNLIEYSCADGTVRAVFMSDSKDAVIAYNTIRFAGSTGLDLNNRGGALIKYNDISYFSAVCRDNGGMYGGYIDGVNTEIAYNWVHDGMSDATAGIYPDNSSNNLIIHHNVGWNIPWGLLLNGPRTNILCYNNTFEGYSHTSWNGVGYSDNLWGINNLLSSRSSLSGNNMNVQGGTFMDTRYFSSVVKESKTLKADSVLKSMKGNDFYPFAAMSAIVDAGEVIEGINDDYVGSAPDIGAYEYGAEKWIPGHDFSDTSRIDEIFEKTEYVPYMNYVQSGGFETSLDDFSWKTTGNKTAYRQTVTNDNYAENEGVHMGKYGLRLGSSGTSGGTDGVKQTISNLRPNTQYILTAAGRINDSTGANPIEMTVTGSASTYLPKVTFDTYKWNEKSVTFVTGTSGEVTISFSKNATGYGYIDTVMVYEATDRALEEAPKPSEESARFTVGGKQYFLMDRTKVVNGEKYVGVMSADYESYTHSKAIVHMDYLTSYDAGDSGVDIPVRMNIRNLETGEKTDIQSLVTKFSPFDGYLIPETNEWILTSGNDSKLYYTGSVGTPEYHDDLMKVHERDELELGEGDSATGFVTGDYGFWQTYYYMRMVLPDGTLSLRNPEINGSNNSISSSSSGGTWYLMTFVHEDFFKENNLDLNKTGRYVRGYIKENYSYDELTGWSEEDKEALFFDSYQGEGIGLVVEKTVDSDTNQINVKVCINSNGFETVPSGTCLVVAAYNGQKLSDVKIIPLEETVSADSISDVLKTELTADGVAAYNAVKVMLWSNNNTKPLCDAVIQ